MFVQVCVSFFIGYFLFIPFVDTKACACFSRVGDVEMKLSSLGDSLEVYWKTKQNDWEKFRYHSFTPQYVGMAFDGSYSLNMWEETRKFAQEMKNIGIPIRFSYFVSGVYFVPESLADIYDLQGYRKGHSDIGWGDDISDIASRIDHVNNAFLEGHEIGSHANGHFDGSEWTSEVWEREFDYFSRFMFPKFDGEYPELDKFQKQLPKLQFEPSRLHGFRAPLLAHNDSMYTVMKDFGYSYGTNKVYFQGQMPKRGLEDIWELPLYAISLAGKGTISMDYNLYYLQTQANSTLKKGTPEWDRAYETALKSYLDLFENHYYGERVPVFIGHHFSLWNDGLYWEVMKGFAREVCGKKDVICGTHEEVAWYLENVYEKNNTKNN